MCTRRKDVHNEYTDILHKNDKDKKKKCNKCGKIVCRNAVPLANHANKCHGYKKYASNGDLIKSRDNDSCHWKSQTSPAPSMTSDDCIISEMKLMDSYNLSTPAQATQYAKKKLTFDSLNDKYDQELNKSDVRSYFNKVPPPMTGLEKEYSHKCWTKFFTVCGVRYKLLQHPLFIKACKSLRPSYDPICPKTSKKTYVKKLREECDKDIKTVMNDKKICVQCDGSENGQKEGVVQIIGSCTFGTRLIGLLYHKSGAKVGADQLISDLEETRLSLLNGNRKRHGSFIKVPFHQQISTNIYYWMKYYF